jgi:small-conductance mechanosensitive channel
MISYLRTLLAESGSPLRVVLIVFVLIGLHLAVIAVRGLSKKLSGRISPGLTKPKTIASLGTSALVFGLYFTAFGLILSEIGVSLKAYLASASIVGLAVGFGSQGLVQDVVTGLTIVFSGLFNVDDMVEISGQTGIVRDLGIRFTVIENSLGAKVYIPNRTITNVVKYPLGYIRGLIDVTLLPNSETARKMEEKVASVLSAFFEQLSGILLTAPSIEGRMKTSSGKEYLRIEFRIWPGRGSPIETALKQEILYELKVLEPNYQDWMVTMNYEVGKKILRLSDN